MDSRFSIKRVRDLFDIRSGEFHATKELDKGDVPLISCGDSDNGFIGFFDIPTEHVHERAITVAYNGSWPLTAKFHPYRFGAKDDVAVLTPRFPYDDTILLYLAALIDRNKWRYSYGRKCFREKLENVRITVPVKTSGESEELDEVEIVRVFSRQYGEFLPNRNGSGVSSIPPLMKWRQFNLSNLFKLRRGDFHSITDLAHGSYVTVSRTATDNGVIGYFDKPDNATVYDSGCITISTVGGDAFVQLHSFIATDNVIVCTPKSSLRPTTLFFIAFMLNRQKWRYSYGRQCYMNKVGKISIELPVLGSGNLDEDCILDIVQQASYWPIIDARFTSGEVSL